MLAEEFAILADNGPLWQAARSLLDVAARLDQMDQIHNWHGWQREQIDAFLAALPSPSSLVVGVWEMQPSLPDRLHLGIVCKVVQGEICSLSTFEALRSAGLKPSEELAIGIEDALEIMHYARSQVAPVAWALFCEKTAWDEWLFTAIEEHEGQSKGELLRNLIDQGRGVLMGSQATAYEDKRY